jgi:hypothetical protein
LPLKLSRTFQASKIRPWSLGDDSSIEAHAHVAQLDRALPSEAKLFVSSADYIPYWIKVPCPDTYPRIVLDDKIEAISATQLRRLGTERCC